MMAAHPRWRSVRAVFQPPASTSPSGRSWSESDHGLKVLLAWEALERRIAKMQMVAARLGRDVHACDIEYVAFMTSVKNASKMMPLAPGWSDLTPRERQVAHHLAGSARDEQVAAALGIRVSTVKTHVRAVLAKLGLHSRWEVARVLPHSRSDS